MNEFRLPPAPRPPAVGLLISMDLAMKAADNPVFREVWRNAEMVHQVFTDALSPALSDYVTYISHGALDHLMTGKRTTPMRRLLDPARPDLFETEVLAQAGALSMALDMGEPDLFFVPSLRSHSMARAVMQRDPGRLRFLDNMRRVAAVNDLPEF